MLNRSTATLLPDGCVLIVGGGWDDVGGLHATAQVWDPTTESFSPAGSLARARTADDAGIAVALPDGRVLIVGGCISPASHCEFGLTDSAEIWDPDTASFGPAGSLAEARTEHTSTLLPDGRVLVVGGDSSGRGDFLASAEVWEPSDG